VGQGSDVGIDFTSTLICEALKQAESKINANCKTKLLVETMSGKGSEIGRNFDEVALILQKAEEKYGSSLKDKVGVCLDTCHIWDGGYDIVNNLDDVLAEFDKKIGIDRLCAIHLNDSMNDFDTHKDRHQKLGQGKIGLQALVNVINHPLLKNLPLILETPNEHDGYKAEIETLKNQFRG
jgi:deoxyribonuclease-4